MTTTAEQITELQKKITAAEQKAQTSTEADRARLEQLHKQAADEATAEQARRAARRQAWARHYLETEHTEQAGQARKDVTAARREFEAVLAEQPWVQALLSWQAALNAQHAATSRAAHARALLGQPVVGSGETPSVLPMLDSEVSFMPIGRVLHYLAANVPEADPAAEVDTLAAHPGGDGDPLAEAVTDEPVSKDDPLAYLARNGARLDVTRYPTDDGTVVMHRNPLSDEWVTTDEGGTVKATSWQTAEAEGRTSNPIDGREFGSAFDAEHGKFVKTRTA